MNKRRSRPPQGVLRPVLVTASGITVLIGALLASWYFAAPVIAPNVVGSSVEDATTSLTEAGINIDIDDAQGTVTDQHPIAGERWFRYQEFILTYTDASGTHTIGGPDADA